MTDAWSHDTLSDRTSRPEGVTFGSELDRRTVVERVALVDRLQATREQATLVILTAPAGYGKTTVFNQWAAADPRSFAWVTVDAADHDPVRLVGRIALALDRIEPVDPAVFRTLAPGAGLGTAQALPELLVSLRSWSRPAVLVLDDVDEAGNAEASDFVRALADGLPPGFQIAVGSRFAFRPGRLRAEERCLELGPADLAFTAAEAGIVLGRADVGSSGGRVTELMRDTEGWPAGVHLAALAVRSAPEADFAAGGPAGDDPFIVDYFRDEVLSRESPEMVRFLLRTAPLDRMCGSLCDRVLGRSGSGSLLREAARRNLFVVPFDRQGEWYRYHHLFAEMLRSELERREPGEALRVHARAAGWYDERHEPETAIAHAIASRDVTAAGELINRHAQQVVLAGGFDKVRDWLTALDDPSCAGYPPLAVTATWIFALAGDPVRAQQYLNAAEHLSFEGPMPDGSTSLESAVTLLRATLGTLGIERMVLDATTAVQLERPGSRWHPLAMTGLGTAHALSGDDDLAAKELGIAVQLGRTTAQIAAGGALAQLSLLAANREDWAAAQRDADDAVQLFGSNGLDGGLPSIIAYAAAARVAAHKRDHVTAQHFVGVALRRFAFPSPAAFPWLSAQVSITLGQVLLELGDFAAARFRIEEARTHLTRLLTEGVLRDQLEALSADLARAGGHVSVPSAMALSAAEMRVLQLLSTHLSLGEIGEQLHISRNTVKTQVAAVYRKLQCSTRTTAVRRARELGLVEP